MATAAKTRSVKFTYEDYLLFPEDGRRHELMEGERFVTPSPNTKHQRVSVSLSAVLFSHLKRTGEGRVFTAPFDVILSDLDVVQPDILFVSASRASIITEKNVQGAPDLVVEIVSETTRKIDETTKRKLYERYGVSEYWIVDPELETVKVHRMTEQGCVRAAELSRESGDTLSTPLLPGLEIPLAEIFE